MPSSYRFYVLSRSMETIKKGELLTNIHVTDATAEGKGIAKIDDFVVFIEGAVAGDVVDASVYRRKKNYAEAKTVNIHQASADRIEPFCEHFGTCGGCKWQHLKYDKQLEMKQQHVKDALERLAKIEIPELDPILGASQTQYYRNKLEYTFSDRAWLTVEEIGSGEKFEHPALGYHIPQRFDKILDIKTCYLQTDPSNAIRNEVKRFAIENGFSFYNPKSQVGFLRNLLLRSTAGGEWMVVVIFGFDDAEKVEMMMKHLSTYFPQITSLQYIINTKRNDTFFDLDVHLYSGRDHINEHMEGLSFTISAKSFYQTNSNQAYELYKITRDFAGLTGNENVYDLYTGTGTIALFVSKFAKKVTGIDFVESAIVDARKNAIQNGITNATFYSGDMKNLLNDDFIAKNGKPDVIITDPPRSGMHPDVVETINKSGAEKIIYVSCNPSTQARDLQILDANYLIRHIKPVDMFPHTTHVENVVLLVNRNS